MATELPDLQGWLMASTNFSILEEMNGMDHINSMFDSVEQADVEAGSQNPLDLNHFDLMNAHNSGANLGYDENDLDPLGISMEDFDNAFQSIEEVKIDKSNTSAPSGNLEKKPDLKLKVPVFDKTAILPSNDNQSGLKSDSRDPVLFNHSPEPYQENAKPSKPPKTSSSNDTTKPQTPQKSTNSDPLNFVPQYPGRGRTPAPHFQYGSPHQFTLKSSGLAPSSPPGRRRSQSMPPTDLKFHRRGASGRVQIDQTQPPMPRQQLTPVPRHHPYDNARRMHFGQRYSNPQSPPQSIAGSPRVLRSHGPQQGQHHQMGMGMGLFHHIHPRNGIVSLPSSPEPQHQPLHDNMPGASDMAYFDTSRPVQDGIRAHRGAPRSSQPDVFPHNPYEQFAAVHKFAQITHLRLESVMDGIRRDLVQLVESPVLEA